MATTPDKKGKTKETFSKIGKALLGVGLPTLATAAGGPMAGMIVTSVTKALGLSDDTNEDSLAHAIATSSPEQVVRLQELQNDYEKTMAQERMALDEQLTKRLEIDTNGDSPLAKLVRPGGLCFVLIAFVLYIYCVTFSMEESEQKAVEPLVEMFMTLAQGFVYFYVGTRGIEKVTKTFKGGK